MYTIVSLLIVLVAFVAWVVLEFRKRYIHLWLGAYLKQQRSRSAPKQGPVHLMFCFVDHFEPGWGRPTQDIETSRVRAWCERYPELAARHRDADGKPPVHTFFYPEEEYREEHLDALAKLCAKGYGEIEIHLHHDQDTEAGLRSKLRRFIDQLHQRHHAMPVDPVSGQPVFGFIHGNWALDNSRADGRWCGVNNELSVLADMGCYADFTLPSAPSETQTSKINSLYYATDHPHCGKSHDQGVDVAVGQAPSGDLLILQGPLTLDWKRRRFGLLPKIENGDIRTHQPPTPSRVDLWVQQNIHVRGRPEWVFVKIHTHGTQDRDMETLLGQGVDDMFSYLERRYNDGKNYLLHYVSAREMYNIVKAAEAGLQGSPDQYRDFILARPSFGVSQEQKGA
jgi:hypothetical protein